MGENINLTPKKVYKYLKRDYLCSTDITVKRIFKNYDFPDRYSDNVLVVLNNSTPFPKISDLEKNTFYIPGGTRFLARYPDIIIDKYDVVRAIKILNRENIRQNHTYEDNITSLVYNLFKFDDLLLKDFHMLNIYPWESNRSLRWPDFFKYSDTFLLKTFRRKTMKNCFRAMIRYPNTLTNISALPYTIGDCREAAWLTLLLCNAGNTSADVKYRICYTTLYIVIDNDRQLNELFDHVFVIKIHNDNVTIVDPFAKIKRRNGILLNNASISIVNNNDISDYTINKNGVLIPASGNDIYFECGDVYVKGVKKYRMFAKPKIYDGSLRIIDSSIFNPDPVNDVLIWNKPIPYTDTPIWKKHKEWGV